MQFTVVFVLPFCDREQSSSALFFQYNTQLGPPYYILVDTNFINFSIKNKLEIVKSMMDCLYAKCKSTVPSFLEWEQQKRNNVFLSMKKKKRKKALQSLYSRSKRNRKYRSRSLLVKAINFQHQKNEKDGQQPQLYWFLFLDSAISSLESLAFSRDFIFCQVSVKANAVCQKTV